MRGYNRAIIAGNLTRDPEVRYTVNKKAYARFGIAVNSRWKNANGELQENTEYINVVAWGNTAETCGKYLKKGSPLLIEGRITTSSYDAKDGSGKRYSTEVVIDNMLMLGSGQGGTGYQVSSGADYGTSGGYTPSDEDFGKSIGESGFGTGGFSGGFADDNSGNSDSGIPF